MSYKDENTKHRLGIDGESKYKCPNCGKGLKLPKVPFMGICGKCKKSFKGSDL